MQTSPSLGEKIKYFRNRAGLSQLALETAIDASPGSISRIESGKVNPTKETLLELSRSLKLSQREMSDLLMVRPLFPANDEVEAAVESISAYMLDPNRLAYMIDEWANVYTISSGFLHLLGVSATQAGNLVGEHLFKILLDPTFGVSKFFDINSELDTLARELARLCFEVEDFENTDVFLKLRKLTGFQTVWDESKKIIDESELFDPKNKTVIFLIDGERKEFLFTREPLKVNPRFEVIEYFS